MFKKYKLLTSFIAMFLIVCLSPFQAFAAIEIDNVENGEVTVQQDGNTYNINATENAIANFKTFDIGAGETVNIILPSETSSMLNRVTGGASSEIFGYLFSNGNIYLVNVNGIHFGDTAQVQAAGFVASTLDISNADFMAGQMELARALNTSPASILNEGNITAQNFAVLAGGAVENTGNIQVQGGTVALAAGDRVTLSLDNGNLINVVVSGEVKSPVLDAKGNVIKDMVKQAGEISASGGQVFLTAQAAEEIFDHVINHTGITEAASIQSVNGRIVIDGGKAGIVRVSGTVGATGLQAGQHGGGIEIYGNKIGIVENALLNVTGNIGGGSVLIGADYKGSNTDHPSLITGISGNSRIQADTQSGDAGKVIVWSEDSTNYYGNISAKSEEGKGGFVEVSSHDKLNFHGDVDVNGGSENGTLLLDPSFLTINDSADGTGSMDGELTPGSDSELLSSVPDDGTNTISRGQLEAFGPDANIILETTGLLRVRDMASNAINLQATTGSLTLKAASLTFNDLNDVIRTEGGSITVEALLSQGKITAGGFDTTGLSGTKSGNISLSANTDISVQSVKTGGGNFTAIADFDKAGNPGLFTINSGGQVNAGTGNVSITASDVNLAGSLTAHDVNLLISRAGTNMTPATIGLGNAAASSTYGISGSELSNITADKLTIGDATNDEIIVDSVTAEQSQNIGEVVLNSLHANRDLIFQGTASYFNKLTASTVRDMFVNASINAASGLTLNANRDIQLASNVGIASGGPAGIHADADGSGNGNLIMTTGDFIKTTNAALDITANDLQRSFNAYFDSGTAAMSFASSDGGQIQVGDGTGDFTIRGDELQHIIAGSLKIGNDSTSQIIFNGVAEEDLNTIPGTITSRAGSILFDGNGSHFKNDMIFNASNGITFNKNLNNTGKLTLNTDYDANGTGDLTTAAGVSVNSTNNTIDIFANDLQLGAGSQISSGNGAMNVQVSDGGSIRLGQGSGDMTVDNTELQVLKSRDLTFKGSNSGITVDGVTGTAVSNVDVSLTLDATKPGATVNFSNNDSTVNFVTVKADAGVNVNAGVTAQAGDITVETDANKDGNGILNVGSTGRLTTVTNHKLNITAPDVTLDGALQIGQQGVLNFLTSIDGADMGLNSSSKTFNLTTDELKRISVLNEGGTNLGKVVFGPTGNTGDILAAGDGLTVITSPYDLTLNFDNLSFGGRLSLGSNNRTMTLNGNTITSSGAREINTTGGTGTLILNTTGDVDLIAFVDQLGASTVGGHLNLQNDQSFKVIGDLNVGTSLHLSTPGTLTLNEEIFTHGFTQLEADIDHNGSGNLVMGTNSGVLTDNHNLDIMAKDLQMTAGSYLNAGTADISLRVSNGAAMSLGQGQSASFAVSHNEIKLMTATNLTIGDNTNGNITVTGVDETVTSGIANTITLKANRSDSSVTFNNNSSTFQNNLRVEAGNGVTVSKNLGTANGTISINADTDANGTGDLTVAASTGVNSNNHQIDITANDINLASTSSLNSFKAPMNIHISDAQTIGLGDATGGMTLDHTELSRIKAGDLTIGDSSTPKIESNGVTLNDLANLFGNLTLLANAPAGQILFSGATSTFKNLYAESGSLFTVAAGAGVSVTDGLLSIKTKDLDLQGTLSNSTGEVRIENTGSGEIALGTPSGQMTLSNSEVQNITANLLHLINVAPVHFAGLTAVNTANINSWNVESAGANGHITFDGTASTLKNAALSAVNGITLDAPVTIASGNFTANADSNADGAGLFQVTGNGSLTAPGTVTVTSSDVDIQGSVTAPSVSFLPSISSFSIGLNDAQGGFNLTASELNFINTANLVIGVANGTGAVFIGSLGAFILTQIHGLTIHGADTVFSNTMTLPDDSAVTFHSSGFIHGSGGKDIVSGGSLSSLTIQAGGDVNLQTTVAKLGTSTAGGDFSLQNDHGLTLTGKLSTKTANGDILLDVNNHKVTVQSGGIESGNGDITIRANDMEFSSGAGTISGLGKIFLEPGTAGTSIGIAGALGTLQLSTADLNALHKNFSEIRIGRADGFGKISINEVSFKDPIVFLSPALGGSILVAGAIHGLVDASITILGSGHTTTLMAGIDTNGRDILIDDAVILGTDVALTTGGGDVHVTGDVNGAHNLSITAGDGNITFDGALGNTDAVGSGSGLALNFSTSSTKMTTFNSSIRANEGIRMTGPVIFKDNVTLDGSLGSTFLDNVTLDGLDFHAAGGALFGDFDSDRVIFSGGPVSISSNNHALTFSARVFGNQDLTLDSGTADTVFTADMGVENSLPQNRIGDGTGNALTILTTGTTSFERLNTNSGIFAQGPVVFHKNVIVGEGDTASIFNGDVTLAGMTFNANSLGLTLGDSAQDSLILADDQNIINVNNADLTINAKVDGAQNLGINTGTGAVDFNAAVGSNEAVGSGSGLAVNSNGTGSVRFHDTLQTHGAIKTTGLAEFDQDVTLGVGDKETLFNGDVIFHGINFTAGHTVNLGNNVADTITVQDGPFSLTTFGAGSHIHVFGSVTGDQAVSFNAGGQILGGNTATDVTAPLILLQAGSGIGLDVNPFIIHSPLYGAQTQSGGIFLINTFPGAIFLTGLGSQSGDLSSFGIDNAVAELLGSGLWSKVGDSDFASFLNRPDLQEWLNQDPFPVDFSALDKFVFSGWQNVPPASSGVPTVVPIPDDSQPTLESHLG